MSEEPVIPTPPGAEDWWPLRTIAEKLDIPIKQMNAWAENKRAGAFPEPKHIHGRYKFYDLGEIQTWVFFHRRATVGIGRGAELNEGRNKTQAD